MLRSPIVEELSVSYHYGFSGPIGAGTYDRREGKGSEPAQPLWEGGGDMVSANLNNLGVTQIAVSKTYRINITKQAVRRITWQAANLKRPYLLLESDLILNTGAANANSLLVLDGLWMGAGQGPRYIYLRGNYECVEIRHCTLDPGGLSNCTLHRKDNPDKDILIQPIILVVDGFVENLCITNCITGPLQSSPTGMVETVYIKDSIVQSIDPDVPAIQLSSGMLNMERVTVFGKMEAYRLQASEIIVTETAVVTDTQTGCFRFSAAPGASRLPRPYESFLYQKDSNHWFTSRRFGHPGYGQLSGTAPEALRRGAENGSEMGAFSNLLNPVKLDGLKAKIEEYMPFGLIPIFINET